MPNAKTPATLRTVNITIRTDSKIAPDKTRQFYSKVLVNAVTVQVNFKFPVMRLIGRYKPPAKKLIKNAELQIRSGDFYDDVARIFRGCHSSVAVFVHSTYGSEFNINLEIWTVSAYEASVQTE